MKYLINLLTIVLLCSSSGLSSAEKILGSERLLLPIHYFMAPASGVEFKTKSPTQTVYNFQNHQSRSAQETLSITVILEDPRSPTEYLNDRQNELEAKCKKPSVEHLSEQLPEREFKMPYQSNFMMFWCNQAGVGAEAVGKMHAIKVIKGEKSLYLLEQAWTEAPYEEEYPAKYSTRVSQTSNYFRWMRLCDDSDEPGSCVKEQMALVEHEKNNGSVFGEMTMNEFSNNQLN